MVWVKLPKLYNLHKNLLAVYRSSLCTAHLLIVDSAFDRYQIDSLSEPLRERLYSRLPTARYAINTDNFSAF